MGEGCELSVRFAPERVGPSLMTVDAFESEGPQATSAQLSITAHSGELLVVRPAGHGVGSVSSVPAGIACPPDCEERFPLGTDVLLTEHTDAGTTFMGWNNPACAGQEPTCRIMATGQVEVLPRFDPWLRVGTQGIQDAGGTVSSVPAGIDCHPDCEEAYAGIVELTAHPDAGYAFQGWSGDCADAGDNDTCVLDVSGPRNAIANFTPYNVAFVTAETYWPGSFGPDGSGADAICQGAGGQLTREGHPNVYRAWIGSSTRDASAILRGARGWIRLDGVPVADRPEDLLAGHLLAPVAVTEYASLRLDGGTVATGVGPDGLGGATAESTCDDWSSNMGTYGAGSLVATTGSWTRDFARTALPCNAPTHLYCFGTQYQAHLRLPPAQGRLIFLSTPWLPEGGVLEADAHCQADATDAGLNGTFRAMVAEAGQGIRDRLTDVLSTTPYARVDGMALRLEGAYGYPMLNPTTAWNVTARGEYVGSDGGVDDQDLVWTGGLGAWRSYVARPGPEDTCDSWRGGVTGAVGRPEFIDDRMIQSAAASCAQPRRLYCVAR